jgi:hypothetical protein
MLFIAKLLLIQKGLYEHVLYNPHSTADVIINADGSCGGGWVCEHRWNVMKKMVIDFLIFFYFKFSFIGFLKLIG